LPRRPDIRSVAVIGSGPIVIGQACEFDYSASQACRVLRREGLRVVLVNSNPATIMTDPEWADATYIEPLDADTLTEIVAAERPDALLPTLGGQTALNLSVELHEAGVLSEYGVELLGASVDAIRRAEDRLAFRDAVVAAGLEVPRSEIVTSRCQTLGPVPAIVRPAFTLGGSGGGIARSPAELEALLVQGERFFVPPYVGTKGWVGIRTEHPRTDWEEVAELIATSYCLTAPKRLAEQVTRPPTLEA